MLVFLKRIHIYFVHLKSFPHRRGRCILLSIAFALCICYSASSQSSKPPFLNAAGMKWADSVLSYLQPDERIAQLMMVAAWSNNDTTHSKSELDSLITRYKIGGLIFFQGGPVRQAILTNHYQSISQVPLMIGI